MKPFALLGTACLAMALASAAANTTQEPFFEGLGSYTRPITTDSPEAQKYFNQGLNFYFGVNHGAAIRAFQAAETIDPDCAMVHWGVARIGHWYEAISANLKAVEANRRYRAVFGEPKGLIVFYAAHNQHMLAYAAMMTGQRDLAIEHIRATVAEMPEAVVKEYAIHAEAFVAAPYEVLVRFGLWDEILAEPDHPEFMVFTRAFRHAARGIAYAAKGDVKSARAEQTAFVEASKLGPAEDVFGNGVSECWTNDYGNWHKRRTTI